MATIFIDVSHHNRKRKPIDWTAVAAGGLGTVMIARATYGDPHGFSPSTRYFGEFMAGAKAAGYTMRGGYHNLIRGDQASINRQVDFFRGELDRHGAEWAMADIEPYRELKRKKLWPRWEDVQRFHDRWYEVEPSRMCAWYIGLWVWRDWLGRPDLRDLRGAMINARYPRGSGAASKLYAKAGGDTGGGWATYGRRAPDIWQFTSKATVPGCRTRTDVNAFRGDLSDLLSLLTGDPFVALSDADQKAFVWRLHALFNNLPATVGGPLTGEPNKLYEELARIRALAEAGRAPADVASILDGVDRQLAKARADLASG